EAPRGSHGTAVGLSASLYSAGAYLAPSAHLFFLQSVHEATLDRLTADIERLQKAGGPQPLQEDWILER
ncbi:hypothetical protein B8W95_14220, partial [Staphylococcus pasteuri]